MSPRRPTPQRPPDPRILALVRALARQAADEDHEVQMAARAAVRETPNAMPQPRR